MVTRFQEASANLFVVTSYETITADGLHYRSIINDYRLIIEADFSDNRDYHDNRSQYQR